MSERAAAHKIAADVLASQHMRADRTVQALAPLAREFLRLTAEVRRMECESSSHHSLETFLGLRSG